MKEIFEYKNALKKAKYHIYDSIDAFFSMVETVNELNANEREEYFISLGHQNGCPFEKLYYLWEIDKIEPLVVEWTRQVIKNEAKKVYDFWNMFSILNVYGVDDLYSLNDATKQHFQMSKSMIKDFAKNINNSDYMFNHAVYPHAYNTKLTLLFARGFYGGYLFDQDNSLSENLVSLLN